MVTDGVADLLIRIKNGYLSKKEQVVIPFSKLNLAICKLLTKQSYLENIKQEDTKILVNLKYGGRRPALTNVKRISKPGLRVYKSKNDLPKVLNGLGIAIISTPKGIMTDQEARKEGLGGEIMAFVW